MKLFRQRMETLGSKEHIRPNVRGIDKAYIVEKSFKKLFFQNTRVWERTYKQKQSQRKKKTYLPVWRLFKQILYLPAMVEVGESRSVKRSRSERNHGVAQAPPATKEDFLHRNFASPHTSIISTQHHYGVWFHHTASTSTRLPHSCVSVQRCQERGIPAATADGRQRRV
jgi:hypothetical protein